jgi:CRP-like cAMP-binding protein
MASDQQAFQRIAGSVRRIFTAREDPEMRQTIEVLKHTAVLRGLPGRVLRDVAGIVHRREYRRDEFIYYERDPGLGLYVVQTGRIRLLAEDDKGAVHELRQVGESDLFGKLSLLGDFRRTETAQAFTDASVLGLFRPDLKTIIKRHPGSGAEVVGALARNLAAMEVELIRVLIEKDGKLEALRLIDNAAARVDHMSGTDASSV